MSICWTHKIIKYVANLSKQKLTVKKLYDVREIHTVAENDIPVSLHQSKCNEEHEMSRGDVFGSPNSLPYTEDVIVYKFCKQ